MEGEVFDDDLDDDNDNNNDDDDNDNDDDNHFGVENNATVYDGRGNSVAAVHQSRLSASPILANVAVSIAPGLTTLSRNGLIAAANEAMRVQKSLEHEVEAFQKTMLSMWNQSQVNNAASKPVCMA